VLPTVDDDPSCGELASSKFGPRRESESRLLVHTLKYANQQSR
jgi:hypothetical protein